MNPEEEKPKKRKRGRPPKKKAELPTFKNERDIRKYLLDTSLELALELKENAVKKNNIKKPNVANAKNQQYKTALTSLKVANEILKDIQIDKFEEQLELIEEGLKVQVEKAEAEEEEPSEDVLEKIDKLTNLTEKLASLKE